MSTNFIDLDLIIDRFLGKKTGYINLSINVNATNNSMLLTEICYEIILKQLSKILKSTLNGQLSRT